MNVWVAPDNNDICFYLSQSGCFDENNTLLKLGRFRVSYVGVDEAPAAGSLKQTLHVDEGYMTVTDSRGTITLWADVEKPVVHIELTSQDKAAKLEVEYQSWRQHDRAITKAECQMTSWKWTLPADATTYADSLSPSRIVAPGEPVWFYHQNRDSTVFDYTVHQQRLTAWRDSLYNPLRHRIFGGRVTIDDDRRHAQIALCCQQSSLDEWWQQLAATEQSVALHNDRRDSRRWWTRYWSRSYIETDSQDTVLQEALRNYALFRYMLGCNAKGEWPTKFNGGLFTFVTDSTDAVLPDTFALATSNPDYRKWGGGTHTAQNQRLVYWGMLKSGNTDMMLPQLDYYLRLLPTAELRSRVYWDHEGACYTEQMENFGLPNPAEYGKHPDKKGNGQDPGVENNRWLEYEWDTALEFCQMALEAHRYAGLDITRYEPMIRSCLLFFDQHYTQNDDNGDMILYPGSGCETYKMALNPASTIAALATVCQSYLYYKHDEEVMQLLRRLPALPSYIQQDMLCIAPAKSWERINNVETPQLYPVWPWRMTGIFHAKDKDGTGTSLYEKAVFTYLCDSIAVKNRTYIGWKQDNIWAACLGLTDEAYELTMQKLASGPYRFPAFWGPGYDWSPDHNWGGSAMIGLEEMLLQEDPHTGVLYLLPSWPNDKNVHFKLHATSGRSIEASLDGQILNATIKDGMITQKISKKFGDVK